MNDCNAPTEARSDCRGRTAATARRGQSTAERAWGFRGEAGGDRA